MTLVAGDALEFSKYFSSGNPITQGSSFDLTIGTIFDQFGNRASPTFTLEAGAMVQVVSAEVFALPKNTTGHVTYKTTLTKSGIWALTVGIVDPGWNGPVVTTLLNFSKVPYVLRLGQPFLRVSLFEHDPVDEKRLRRIKSMTEYLDEAQEKAITRFPPTFLNQEEIGENAGKQILARIRTEAVVWVGAIAFIFTMAQWLLNSSYRGSLLQADAEFTRMRAKVEALQDRVEQLELRQATTSPPAPKVVNPLPPPPGRGRSAPAHHP